MPFGSEIEAMIKSAKESKPEKRTVCPVCDWTLEEKNGVLYCPYCGWYEGISK